MGKTLDQNSIRPCLVLRSVDVMTFCLPSKLPFQEVPCGGWCATMRYQIISFRGFFSLLETHALNRIRNVGSKHVTYRG